MNKLIDGLFEHKILVRVLSVLTAILLWFIVLDNNNPMMTRTLSVIISANPEVLEDNNLRVIGIGAPVTADVTIRGRSSQVADVTSNDFRIVLDYQQVKSSGDVTLQIGDPDYVGDRNIRLLSMNPTAVKLRLERITGVEFPVKIRWAGVMPDGFQATNIRVEPSTVRFEDKESLVDRIGNVVVILDAAALEKTSGLTKRVLVLDSEGQSITQFDGKNSVTVSYDLVRTLPVETRVAGTPAPDWFVTGFQTVPAQVQVLGKFEALSGLGSVQAETISVDGQEGSFATDLTLTVPEGFSLYDTKPQVKAEVQMEKLVTREFAIPVERIGIFGHDPLSRTLQFLEEAVAVTVKGKAQEFEQIGMEQLMASLDTSNLADGESAVPVRVSAPAGFSVVGEPRIRLSLTPIPVEGEEGTTEPGTGEPADGQEGTPPVDTQPDDGQPEAPTADAGSGEGGN